MSIFKAYTPAFKNASGNILKNSIAEMQMVPLGNTKQSVIIRGEDRSNPVLLLVHGGPGSLRVMSSTLSESSCKIVPKAARLWVIALNASRFVKCIYCQIDCQKYSLKP